MTRSFEKSREAADGAKPEMRAKFLERRLPVAGEPPELVPARMVNEVLYCERCMYLEWSQGEFEDNAFTVEGRAVHQRADRPGGRLPPKPSLPAEAPAEERPYQARSVWLSSEALRLTAKIDVVEGAADGSVVPIEYKRGQAPDAPRGAWLPELAQVCAQALLLREHGYRVTEGAIYFAGSRKRVPVVIDDELVQVTLSAVARARRIAAEGRLPEPLVDDPRCDGCSLVGICLPDETNLLKRLEGAPPEELDPPARAPEDEALYDSTEPDPWGLSMGEPERELRRLLPARDDRVPLYVQDQGARVTLDGDELAVLSREGRQRVRLSNTSQVCLMGNVQVTTQATRALLERSIPVAYFSRGGWFYGRMLAHESKNVELRIAQYRATTDPELCLQMARQLVAAKIRNARTLLRRNHKEASAVTLSELEQLAKKSEAASELSALLGLEGTAARSYFGAFSGMLRGEAAEGGFDWEGRSRRPPTDPINALLSYAYSLLSKELTVALSLAGLEPMLGFYHQPRFGRPALALDLMEEFRPLLADSVVLGVLNNGVIGLDDFTRMAGAASLEASGRRKFLLAWERRLDQLVTHPVFGYRISYRRVLEVQARLLGRYLLGEIDDYPSFRTR